MRPAWADIDLGALHHNLKTIRTQAGKKRVLAILKANAYGHGLSRIAQELQDIDAIGVARVDEALQLRNAGVTQPIVLLEGFFEAKQIPVLAASNIQPVLHTKHQVNQLLQADNLPQAMRVWIKVDTGMHRLGLNLEDVERVYTQLKGSRNVVGEPVIMSHFACADEPAHPQNQVQLARYAQAVKVLPESVTSMANSAALFASLAPDYDWVRPGLSLYGISPFPGGVGRELALQPVMNLQASLISIRKINQGESVGYGAAWTAPHDTWIGIVAIGYGDGYPRHAPQGTPVWINGKEYPLVGRVAMDMITVELGPHMSAQLGDTAQLWGPDLAVERVAETVGTIPYELLCNVARRVNLHYIDGHDVSGLGEVS
ncbi:alanine racemase [Aliidiomarina sanyensis]|uniref:Alanine racemase n=2 Tax=Aliidiomarina sanyensis TaxID=1249555 RepID=A0A432WB42_9GAMM|nr:alanine racemase [Aliidiomarina sanyensis]